MLYNFLITHRTELIQHCREKVSKRYAPAQVPQPPTSVALPPGTAQNSFASDTRRLSSAYHFSNVDAYREGVRRRSS